MTPTTEIADRVKAELADAGAPLSQADIRARLGRANASLVMPVAAAIKRSTARNRVSGELAVWLIETQGLPAFEEHWRRVGGTLGLVSDTSEPDGLRHVWIALTGEQLRRLMFRLPVIEESPAPRRRGRR